MKLSRENREEVLVISFPENVQLEGTESTRFREELKSAVDEGWSRIVLDLEAVDFIDSTGLGSLISALKRLRSKGGRLRLARPSEAVRCVFEITRLDRVFASLPTVEEAVTAAAGDGEPEGGEE